MQRLLHFSSVGSENHELKLHMEFDSAAYRAGRLRKDSSPGIKLVPEGMELRSVASLGAEPVGAEAGVMTGAGEGLRWNG